MSSRASDLLSSLFSGGLQPATPPLPRSMVPMKARPPPYPPPLVGEGREGAGEFTPPVSRRRTAIWDMHHSMHCSIVGTCLSSAEIRRLLIKLGAHGAESADDHELHK